MNDKTKEPGEAGALTPSGVDPSAAVTPRVTSPAKVYVLEAGCYEDNHIIGVFASPEAAMAAWQPKPSTSHERVKGSEYGKRAGEAWSYEWSERGRDDMWGFGADWDHAAGITEYEVKKTR